MIWTLYLNLCPPKQKIIAWGQIRKIRRMTDQFVEQFGISQQRNYTSVLRCNVLVEEHFPFGQMCSFFLQFVVEPVHWWFFLIASLYVMTLLMTSLLWLCSVPIRPEKSIVSQLLVLCCIVVTPCSVTAQKIVRMAVEKWQPYLRSGHLIAFVVNCEQKCCPIYGSFLIPKWTVEFETTDRCNTPIASMTSRVFNLWSVTTILTIVSFVATSMGFQNLWHHLCSLRLFFINIKNEGKISP